MIRFLVLLFLLLNLGGCGGGGSSGNAGQEPVAQASGYIYDSFTDSNGTALEKHTGDTGSGWSRMLGSGSAYIDGTNSAECSVSDVTYVNLGGIPSSDYSVIATIHMNKATSGTNMGVSGRIDTKANSRYFAIHAQGVGWGLYAADGAGHETRIGPVYGPEILEPGNYVVELRMRGSTISMYIDNVLAASGTDTSYASGPAGIESCGTGAGSDASYEMLDFRVTSP